MRGESNARGRHAGTHFFGCPCLFVGFHEFGFAIILMDVSLHMKEAATRSQTSTSFHHDLRIRSSQAGPNCAQRNLAIASHLNKYEPCSPTSAIESDRSCTAQPPRDFDNKQQRHNDARTLAIAQLSNLRAPLL